MEVDKALAAEMTIRLPGASLKTRDAYIRYCYCLAEDIVNAHLKEIQTVADSLVERKKLVRSEIVDLISPATRATTRKKAAATANMKKAGKQ